MSVETKMNLDFKEHWDSAYKSTQVNKLGWYEEEASQSLKLIKELHLPFSARLFHAGAGASTLISSLINLGYQNIIVNDIAPSAIELLKEELKDLNNCLEFIIDDLTNPSELLKLKEVDLWHDRAVLHFFTDKAQQLKYFELLRKVVKKDGFVILAEFNLEGAKKCSGLDVCNYDAQLLSKAIGTDFQLIKFFNYDYVQPSGGARPFVYTLFKRIDK